MTLNNKNNNTSNEEVLLKDINSSVGDIYVQDVHRLLALPKP
jgi:hypothetical protein